MTTAEAYVKYLENQNIKTLFCIPGGTIYPLLDVLRDSSISLVCMGHEQSLVHAAEGFHFVTRKPAVALITSGPGVTNTLTGIADASFDHRALIVIAGQVPAHFIGKRSFQDLDIVSLTNKLCKFSAEANTSNEAISFLHRAYQQSLSIPCGPTLVSVPKNLWKETVESIPDTFETDNKVLTEINDIFPAVDILNKGKRPLLLLGQGVNDCTIHNDLIKLAESNFIPVTSTLHALGTFPTNKSIWLGMVGMFGTRRANFAVANCDTLLILGASLNERIVGNPKKFAPYAKIIHVDINPQNLGRFVQTDIKICSFTNIFIEKIKSLIKIDNQLLKERVEWVNSLLKHANAFEEPGYCSNTNKKETTIFEFYKMIDGYIKEEDLIVADCGLHQMWAAQFFNFKRPQQFLTTGGFGTMGFALSAAIGASLADSRKRVWCIIGDGGLTSSLQELGTLKELGCNIKIIVFNNSGFGMVRQAQDLFFNKRRVLSDLKRHWLFENIGNAFGIYSRRVESLLELRGALESCSGNGPILLDLKINEDFGVYPIMRPNGSNSDLLP